MDLTEANKALSKAKIGLMNMHSVVFFTTICFSLKHVWDDTIPTACVDGIEIRYNTAFFMKLTPEERVFLLVHEACHVAYGHIARLGTRNHAKFNVAADHVINLILLDRGFKMPKGGLADPQYRGMSTEEVYNLLPEQDPMDVDLDIKESTLPPEELAEHIQDILVRASVHSKMAQDKAGTIPGEIQLFLDKLLDPKLPWHRILQKYMHSMSKSDYTYRKPNRRFFPQYHLPSLYSESLTDIAIAVDISGSVSDYDFMTFVSEITGIFRNLKPKKISVIQFDTDVRSVTVVKSVRELKKIEFKGRGGTIIAPVIDWINKNKPKVTLLFTDGEFRFNTATTKLPIVWLIHGNKEFKAAYGKIVHYDI